MKKSIFVLFLTAIFVAGLYGYSSAQKKPVPEVSNRGDETKPAAHTMHDHMSKMMEDMDNMMTEMQEGTRMMEEEMKGSHAGMSNEDMAKMHERMNQMNEQMRQMRQQLSDIHKQMMGGGEGGMMGRGMMGHDPSTRGGHMGGTEHGTSRSGHEMGSGGMHGGSGGGMDMMKQKK